MSHHYGVMTEPNGFYYMRARYYDTEVGRFISEDPIGFNGGQVNLYAYVGNNPVLLIDPSGLIVLYRGGGGAIGAGYKVNPTDQDPVTFMSGSAVHYGGSTRSGDHVSGMAFTGGAGRMVGVATGGGVVAGVHFGDVEDLSGPGASTGLLLGPISIELTFGGDMQTVTGGSIGVLNKGIGLGFYGQETRTETVNFK